VGFGAGMGLVAKTRARLHRKGPGLRPLLDADVDEQRGYSPGRTHGAWTRPRAASDRPDRGAQWLLMTEPQTWEELEWPVLRWAHDSVWAQTGGLEHLSDKRSTVLPSLTDRQLDDALRRLADHGLIVGERTEALTVWWTKVRPTADGLRVLGEWPPVEAATLNVTLARVLRTLAGDLDEETATATKRAASTLSRMSGEVVLDVVKERIQSGGGDLIS
jgi:hypothetical protein